MGSALSSLPIHLFRDTAAHYRLPSLPLPLLLPLLPIHLFRDTMALCFHHCRCHQSLMLATCRRFHLPFITILQRFVSTIISLISRMYFKNQMYYVSTIKHTIQKKGRRCMLKMSAQRWLSSTTCCTVLMKNLINARHKMRLACVHCLTGLARTQWYWQVHHLTRSPVCVLSDGIGVEAGVFVVPVGVVLCWR